MSVLSLLQEWFYRLAQQCCFAGQPKDQNMKANIPHEAIQMLSVLSVKEVSEIVNHEVGFYRRKTNKQTNKQTNKH